MVATTTGEVRNTADGSARAVDGLLRDGHVHPDGGPPRRRLQLGLRARTTVAAALLALAATALLSAIAYSLVRTYLLSQRDSYTARQSYVNARVVRDVLSQSATPDVGALLGSLRSDAGSYPLIRFHGQWFGSNVGGTAADALPVSFRQAIDAQQSARQRYIRDGQPYSAVGVNLHSVDAVYVEVFPLDQLRRNLVAMALSLLAGSAVTVFGAAAVGHWVSRQVLRPVARVADAAEALAAGGLDTRLPPVSDPDLRRVVRSFNEMADAIQTRIEREARFTSDVSHELRTPLAALAAASDVMVRRRDELSGPAQQALDIMARQIERFTTMVLDLLEISRIDAGMADINLEPVALGWLSAKVVAASGYEDVEVDIAPDAASAHARVDRRRFERMLTNLLDNANRYSGSGGGGAADGAPDGAVRVVVRLDSSDDRLSLHVDDAGPGIAPEERAVIFDRFVRGTTSANTTGTGLGLALVREHAKLHDATVDVGDSPEGGARFTISFPRFVP